MTTDNNDNSIESRDVFRVALFRAIEDLDAVKEQEKSLAIRKSQLNETIRALGPLVFPGKAEIKSLALPDAIRMIFNGLDSDRLLTASDVRTKLLDLGYDLAKYGDNPLANIATTLSRMAETKELRHVPGESKKKQFEAGPELKPVPEATGALVDALSGLDAPGEKARKTIGQLIAEGDSDPQSDEER